MEDAGVAIVQAPSWGCHVPPGSAPAEAGVLPTVVVAPASSGCDAKAMRVTDNACMLARHGAW